MNNSVGFKESLESYKLQQMENLKNMDRYAYNRVSKIETFGTNVVDTEGSDVVDTEVDNIEDDVVYITNDDTGDDGLDEKVSYENNVFNNTYNKPSGRFGS